jgi:predicted SAM-dependent methyltransferase
MKKKIKYLLSLSFLKAYENFRDRKNYRYKIKDRQVLNENYLAGGPIKKLQIGCGSNILDDWLNTDLNPIENVSYLDAGKPFPFKKATFTLIFSEHLFEHLDFEQQINMLKECHRVLVPGGVLRIATPSLEFLFGLYKKPTEPIHQEYVNWAINRIPSLKPVRQNLKNGSNQQVYVVNNFFRAWGHKLIHDFSSLENLVQQIGFSEIRKVEVGESDIPEFKNIEKHGEIIPSKMNLLETMVVEIVK